MTQIKNAPQAKKEERTTDIAKTVGAPAVTVPAQEKKTNKNEAETMDAKVTRVYDLYETVQRLETLKRNRAELQAFKIGSSGMRSRLIIVDDQGKNFETTNANAIALLVSNLLEILDLKILETENQINL